MNDDGIHHDGPLGAAIRAILTEAREHGADSPVDYGDAEQLARAVLNALGIDAEVPVHA